MTPPLSRLHLIRETVTWLIEAGVVPVRLEAQKKKPIGNAWGTLRPTPDEFTERDNIGIKVGASSELVDIDCDWPESRALAPMFLPQTSLINGRASAPRSHYWYRVAGDTGCEQFKDPTVTAADKDKAMIVEFRGGTHTDQRQTMIPPSIHPDGETLEWHQREGAAKVEGDSLLRSTRILAAASLLAKHWPGSRHEASLAVCGSLARAGWNEEQIAKFVTAIARWTNRGEPEISDGEPAKRRRQASDSVAKLKAGHHVTGIPTLINLGVPERVIAKIRLWLELPDVAMGDNPANDEQQVGELDDFERSKKGELYHSQANVRLALRKLGVSVSLDEFSRHELISGLDGFGPRVDDAAMRELRLLIDERFTFRLGKEFFLDVVSRQAWRNRFHPVRDYLAGLKWDGTCRIDEWLINAGAPDTIYVRAVSRLVLIAAVRRVRQPGVKFDEMPILESKQGTNKSSALRVLAVRDEWFTDDLPLDGDTKHLIEQTGGKWLVEAGELKGMSKGDVAKLKACLSRQVDEARLAYGHKNTIAPRQFVVIGTTNETEDYLKDTTGNRRFWPVRIEQFDLARLRRDRDQLWAEAAFAEAHAESIRLSPHLWGDAASEQDERRVEDPMVPILAGVLGDLTGKLRVTDALRIVGVDGKATQDQAQRLGVAMRDLGWERAQRRADGEKVYWYVRGAEHERGSEIVLEVSAFGARAEITARRRGP